MTLTFDEAAHVYRVDGRVVPHVTGVLRSALGDPFARVPPAVLERKRQIGTSAHLARHYDDAGELDESSVHPDVMPYLEAWRRFRSELRFVVVMSERRVYSRRLDVAGALDLFVRDAAYAWRGIIDFKSGLPGPLAALQTAAYAAILDDVIKENSPEEAFDGWSSTLEVLTHAPMRRFAMQALPNSKYRLTEYTSPADLRDFTSCVNVARLKERLAA